MATSMPATPKANPSWALALSPKSFGLVKYTENTKVVTMALKAADAQSQNPHAQTRPVKVFSCFLELEAGDGGFTDELDIFSALFPACSEIYSLTLSTLRGISK